jgi:hypothetical protein
MTSSTMVILGPSGKKLGCHVVETNANLLVDLLKGIPRPRHLCFEEGTQSAWLYETLSPHVDEIVVTVKRDRRGSKDDQRDALELADKLRTNSIEVRVYYCCREYALRRFLVGRRLAAVHQPYLRGRLHCQPVVEPQQPYCPAKLHALALAAVSQHHIAGDACLRCPVDHVQRQLDLVLEDSVLGDSNFGASGGLVDPAGPHPKRLRPGAL